MIIQNLLKWYFSNNKQVIGLSITPEGMVEAVRYSAALNKVTEYAYYPITFNPVKKIVNDINELSNIIEKIVAEFDVKEKTPIILNLPNVYFGFIEYGQEDTPDSSIYSNIMTEVHQSYTFRQSEPLVDMLRLKNDKSNLNKVAYCATHKAFIDELREILLSFNLVPVAIENSYASVLKALQHFGFIKNYINSDEQWGLVMINSNSFTIFSFVGDNVVDITEDAVAIKTYEKSEVNFAVSSVISSALENYRFSSLLFVNNSSETDINEIVKLFAPKYNVNFVENNGSRVSPFFEVGSKILPQNIGRISLFVLGAVIYNLKENFLLKFDFCKYIEDEIEDADTIKLMGIPVELTDINCLKLCLLCLFPFFLFFITVYIGADSFNRYATEQIESYQQKTQQFEQERQKYLVKDDSGKFDPLEEISNIMKVNKYNITCYNSLSANIPQSIWLTYFYGNIDKATVIRGRTNNVNDIYQFFRGIRNSVKSNDLLLSNMYVSPDNPSMYEFEITNSQYDKLVSAMKSANKEYQDETKKINDETKKKFDSSYLPLAPINYTKFSSSKLENEEKELDDEIKILEEVYPVEGEVPDLLPPT